MKRVSIAFVGAALLGSCATSSDVNLVQPGRLMEDMIQERIDQIPYQHKSELLTNLLWLTQAGEQAIPKLASALRDSNPKVRSSAAWVFGRMGNRKALPHLQGRQNDANQIVRFEIARSMLLLGDYTMVPELIRGLNSELQHVRYLCYDALKTTTGKSFEYDHRATDAADRETSISQWQNWWSKQDREWLQQRDPQGVRSGIGQPAAPQGR